MFRLQTLIFLIGIAPLLRAGESGRYLLSIGDSAPAFEAKSDQGKVWRSDQHIGKCPVVVYFFPADMSDTCTRQANEFQKCLDDLTAAGVAVVGVSGDSVENHRLFRKTHGLQYRLLADEDGQVASAFGVPVRKGGKISRVVNGQQLQLKRSCTAQRWTFVIGLDGQIVYKNTNVDPAADCKSVLQAVRQLTASTR